MVSPLAWAGETIAAWGEVSGVVSARGPRGKFQKWGVGAEAREVSPLLPRSLAAAKRLGYDPQGVLWRMVLRDPC